MELRTRIRAINFFVKDGKIVSTVSKGNPMSAKPGDTLRFQLVNNPIPGLRVRPQIGSFEIMVGQPRQFQPGTAQRTKIWTSPLGCRPDDKEDDHQSFDNAIVELRLATRFYFDDLGEDEGRKQNVFLTYVFRDPKGQTIDQEGEPNMEHTWIHVEDC